VQRFLASSAMNNFFISRNEGSICNPGRKSHRSMPKQIDPKMTFDCRSLYP
jgi:hypothetical protein